MRIPGDLAVVMGVDVNPGGGYQQAVGVDGATGRAEILADAGDTAVGESDVAGDRLALPVPSTMVPPLMSTSCIGYCS